MRNSRIFYNFVIVMKEAEISVGSSIVAVADTGDCYGPEAQGQWKPKDKTSKWYLYMGRFKLI